MSKAMEQSRIEYAVRGTPTDPIDARKLVKQAIDTHGDRVSVACSFGSCSVVVLHMALQVNSNIKVVFNDTGVEYPETYRYRDLLVKLWNLNLIETKPKKNFWKCVKEYGFPLLRSQLVHGKSRKPQCCLWLKEYPMKEACKVHDIEAALTGLRASESGVRMFTIAQRGQFYHTKKYGSLWRFHPIAFWNRQQVHEYLSEQDIPINEIYSKGKDRSGCMPCTGFIGWQKELARANPKMYRIVQRMRGVGLMDNFLELEERALCESSGDDSLDAFKRVIEEFS